MAIDLKVEGGKIRNNLNIYALYIFVSLVIFILLAVFGNNIYKNITQKRKDIVSLESEVSKLNIKIDALKSINKKEYTDLTVLSRAFPEEDPSLFAYSQLNELALRNAVFIYDLNFDSGDPYPNGILSGQLNFYASGPRDKVITFLSDLIKDAPLSGFKNISFQRYVSSGEIFTINASVDFYYSPYPKVITSLESSVIPLNEAEKKGYNELIDLKILSGYDIKPQGPSTEKIDPFTESVGVEGTPTPVVTPEASPEIVPEVTPVANVTPGEINQ